VGSLRTYSGHTLAVVATAAIGTLIVRRGWAIPDLGGVLAPDLALALILAASALAVLGARNFVSGIVAAGMVGFAVADLAFTQFSVEALAIVLLLAIVGWPGRQFRPPPSRPPGSARMQAR